MAAKSSRFYFLSREQLLSLASVIPLPKILVGGEDDHKLVSEILNDEAITVVYYKQDGSRTLDIVSWN